jgi:large subunit ribosomal protein L15
MDLSNLHPPEGAFTKRKRVGRGYGSGRGKTSGRGQKGQKARTGHHYMARHFVGGQTPIQQQLPYKRGFKNRFRVEYQTVSLEQLDGLIVDGPITVEVMTAAGLVRNGDKQVKVLGDGEITRAINVTAHRFSASARQAIEAAGGQVTVLNAPAAEDAPGAEEGSN